LVIFKHNAPDEERAPARLSRFSGWAQPAANLIIILYARYASGAMGLLAEAHPVSI